MDERTLPPAERRDRGARHLFESSSQAYALVRSGEPKAVKIGGRGQWRVERSELETYIARAYEQTSAFVKANPLERGEPIPED